MMAALDLFSGIGGNALALERAGGFRMVAMCESDPWCRQVLAKHWPDVPIFEDVTTLTGDDIGPVDLVCGGPPCQRTSVAAAIHGKRTGDTLAGELVRLAVECSADRAVIEQPAGNARWETEVQASLEGAGYHVARLVIALSDCGAPHRRRRVFVVADRDRPRLARARAAIAPQTLEVARLAAARGTWHPDSARAVRVADGVPARPYRRERIAALGNALSPVQAEIIGRALLEAT